MSYPAARIRHRSAHRERLRCAASSNRRTRSVAPCGELAGGGSWDGQYQEGGRFQHHFSHAWLDRGGAEGDLMELNGWASPQMLRRYGASARSARARRSYDRVMEDAP
jgi:hypothetical protein